MDDAWPAVVVLMIRQIDVRRSGWLGGVGQWRGGGGEMERTGITINS